MNNKKTLDEWLSWQEQLMEETMLLGLERVQLVYQRLFPDGVPFFTITVAGTNGKGSTIALIDSIYRESKYSVGCCTSPHLINYNERYTIDGEIVNDEVIINAFEAIEAKREDISLTYFEFSTLAALIIFSEADVDIAVLEVGLGGRLDSINVVDSDVSVITNIAIDHTEYLGDTRESIGTEKAGIMRTAKPCICGDQDPPDSVIAYAKKIGTPLTLVKEQYEGEIGLEGVHQRLNAAIALKVIEAISGHFPVSREMIKNGIKQAQIVARFETLNVANKTVILDVAHNPAAVETLVNTLSDSPMETVAIFSALADKNIDDMIKLASSNIRHWFLVPLSTERSVQMDTLENKFDNSQETTVCANMASAIEQTLALEEIQRVVIFGSFYTVADASVILKEI